MSIGLRNNGRVFLIPKAIRYACLLLALAGACLAGSGRILTAPAPPLRSFGHGGWTVADFDGDSRPDVAVSKSEARGAGYVYWLELDLSTKREGASHARSGLPAIDSSIFGLHLTPRDVDGDRDLDIVVTSGIARQPVAVWINDGQGRFQEGDLAAYPAWVGREDIGASPRSSPESRDAFYEQCRRSGFALPCYGSLRPGLRSTVRVAELPQSSIPQSPSDDRGARPPPFVL
jgi:hypothetical protein